MQHEVYEFLKSNPRWFTSTELRIALDLSESSINMNLRRLEKYKIIQRRPIRSAYNHLQYQYKIVEKQVNNAN